MAEVEVLLGDITRVECDAMVNAANARLHRGGGVDGAIHRAAGPGLQAELEAKYPEGCPPGSAVLTDGHLLPRRYVVHAVGPVWRAGGSAEPERLASAYRTAPELAAGAGSRVVAVPLISTGVYGYPLLEAARIAVAAAVAAPPPVERVILVAFHRQAHSAVRRALTG
ncbi:MAG: macro domain-containing protein [Candidatus Dormibacteria bacterium]